MGECGGLVLVTVLRQRFQVRIARTASLILLYMKVRNPSGKARFIVHYCNKSDRVNRGEYDIILYFTTLTFPLRILYIYTFGFPQNSTFNWRENVQIWIFFRKRFNISDSFCLYFVFVFLYIFSLCLFLTPSLDTKTTLTFLCIFTPLLSLLRQSFCLFTLCFLLSMKRYSKHFSTKGCPVGWAEIVTFANFEKHTVTVS